MASLRILVPEGTTNYVKNPSFRYDTSGWSATAGASLARSLERSRYGFYSGNVITNGTALHEGVYVRVTGMLGLQTSMTASIYLRGAGIVRLRLADNLSGKQWASQPIALSDRRWERYEVSGYCLGGDDVRLYVETETRTQAITFYVDGAQIEPKPYSTTYCDGDQAGCLWNIVQHNSISSRSPYTRSGGRWISLVGCGRDEQNLYLTVLGGMGVAPIQNNIQSYASAPGSFYQSYKVLNRSITIAFHVKSPDMYGDKEKSLRDLHALRKILFGIIRPDKVAGAQEFVLEYQDGDFPLYIGVRYEAGLEGEWDIRNPWQQSFPVRFLAVSPFMWSDNYETAALNYKTRDAINYAMCRTNGQWQAMNGGMNALIYDFAIGKRGEVYAVGAFTKSNNLATATNPLLTTGCVAYWDGSQWQAMNGGVGAGTVVNAVAIAPNGDVYVTGSFTSIGGVACNNVARWNGAAWSALGTGLNGAGFCIKVAPNGDVYVGGSFTSAGGVPAYYCARWNGAWVGIGGALGLNNQVYSVDISPDGTSVYFGGAFTDEYGSPGTLSLLRIAEYYPDFNQFYEVGDGFSGLVRKIALSPSGALYACGDFVTSGLQGMLYISYWDGSAWHDLDAGADNTVRNIDIDAQGNVLAVGDFTRIGSADARGVALYNGTSWVNIDANPLVDCYAVRTDSYGNIFLSPNAAFSDFASITTIDVLGTAEANPTLYFVGPCTLRWIENQTAQKRIYVDLDILSGEEVTLDLGTGKMQSAVRGDLLYSVLAGSDLRAWTLLPESNKISILIVNDISATCRVYYAPRYWSADATADESDW